MSSSSNKIKGWVRVLMFLVPYLIVLGISEIIAYMLLGISITGPKAETSSFQTMIISFSNLIGTILVIAFFRKFVDKESFVSIGLSFPPRLLRDLLWGIGLGAAIQSIGFFILLGTGNIHWASTNFSLSDLLCALALFISVAFVEEMFSRGYIQNNLMESMPRFVALGVSAALFSLMHIFNDHFSWFNFLSIFLAGILLGLPYVYTRNLWMPIALHFSWNFFQGPVFGFNVSGGEFYSFIVQSRTEDNLLNGGEFGFEGSALCVVFQLIIIAVLFYYFNKKEKATFPLDKGGTYS